MDECIKLGEEITKNSYNAVKVSKMLINKGMDVDIQTGLRLEIYDWALCFAHKDRQKMMSAFLNKRRTKKSILKQSLSESDIDKYVIYHI